MAGNQQPQSNSILRGIGKQSTRSVRKVERPRPLKLLNDQTVKPDIIEHGDDVLHKIEYVVKHINNSNFDNTITSAIREMHMHLRNHGIQLETKFKDQLDRYFVALRNASRDTRLDVTSRLRILEIIELRASGWRYNENLTNYYKHKYQELDQLPEIISTCNNSSTPSTTPLATPTNNSASNLFPTILNAIPQVQMSSTLGPGEILRGSGKYAKPTKIPGKNYYKDEIVIRNSDSGKVMGIKGRRVHMIEEFSDTVISFQRVSQGAKDRLVQITGPNEECIGRAKSLIEETIRRNASPVRERSDQDLYGSDSSLTSSNEDADTSGVGLMSHFRGLGGRKGQQLSHSLSMNDASIGEYQYTVTVGRDTLKISGSKLDLVKEAKLLLEDYLTPDAEKRKRESQRQENSVFISTSSQRPINDFYFTDDPQFGGTDEFIPLQQSPSYPSGCNGYLMDDGVVGFQRISSSGSESEEVTYKESDLVKNASDEQLWKTSGDTSKSLTSPGVTVIRQPLFPDSPKQAFEEVENSANMQVLCAKSRRAHFAKTTELLSASESAAQAGDTKPPSIPTEPNNDSLENNRPRITYTREFLLNCANSPYCRVTPKDMPHIVREVPYLLKKTPDIFDPNAYQSQDFSSHQVFPVLRSSSTTVMADYDEDDLV